MGARIHFSRLLDFISGSAAAAANNKLLRSALYKDFDVAKLEDKKLRQLIDSNLPTFYVVDLNLIHSEIIKAISVDTFKENEDYINSTVFSNRSTLNNKIKKVLEDSINKIGKKDFIPIMNELDTMYNQALNDLSKRSSYIGYRNIVAKLAAAIRIKLKNTSAFIATDGAQIVSNLGPNSYVVVGPTFEYTKNKINTLINTDIKEFFVKEYSAEVREYNAKDKVGFSVGNLVNAGHTAAYSSTDKLIGVNMPYAQQTQFLLSGSGKEGGVDSVIADLYLESKYIIKFDQNFTSKASSLLGLQFSFVVSMPSSFNSNELRVQEVARIKEYIKGTVLPGIKEQVLNKFKGGLIEEVIPNTGASPSIIEHITTSILRNLKGKEEIPFIKSTTNTIVGNKIKIPVIKKSSITAIKPPKIKQGKVSVSIPIRTLQNRSYSLASLQMLINSHLQNVISANMGGGSEKAILNYRTGRFAASAQVERLSQSRDGMITAFYNYMKNPYQTFEPGYKQGSPRTRDPKLLIAGSIREIAATKVGNKLRAVSV